MEFIEWIEEMEAAEAVLPVGHVIRDRTNPLDAYDDDRFCLQVFPQIFNWRMLSTGDAEVAVNPSIIQAVCFSTMALTPLALDSNSSIREGGGGK